MELSVYLNENYGTCDMKRCVCLKNGWIGTGCYSWKPLNASSWEELKAEQRKLAPVA